VVPKLREQMPHLLTLGVFDAAQKTGPAVWLRCIVARALSEANWSEETVPVVYLPGVSRQDFRSIEECPKKLLPLMELHFRGTFWPQANHKDWPVLALLQSGEGGRRRFAQFVTLSSSNTLPFDAWGSRGLPATLREPLFLSSLSRRRLRSQTKHSPCLQPPAVVAAIYECRGWPRTAANPGDELLEPS